MDAQKSYRKWLSDDQTNSDYVRANADVKTDTTGVFLDLELEIADGQNCWFDNFEVRTTEDIQQVRDLVARMKGALDIISEALYDFERQPMTNWKP